MLFFFDDETEDKRYVSSPYRIKKNKCETIFCFLTRKKKKKDQFLYEFISIWTEERDELCLDVNGMREDTDCTRRKKEKRYIYILMRYTHAYTQQQAHQEEKKMTR